MRLRKKSTKFVYSVNLLDRKLRIQLLSLQWIRDKQKDLEAADIADLVDTLLQRLPTSSGVSPELAEYIVCYIRGSRPTRKRGRGSALSRHDFGKMLDAASHAEKVATARRRNRRAKLSDAAEPYRTGIRLAAQKYGISTSKLEKFMSWLNRERVADQID